MAGRGVVFPEECERPSSRPILLLSGRGEESHWKAANEPLHAEVDEGKLREISGSSAKALAGKGPGMSFASRSYTPVPPMV